MLIFTVGLMSVQRTSPIGSQFSLALRFPEERIRKGTEGGFGKLNIKVLCNYTKRSHEASSPLNVPNGEMLYQQPASSQNWLLTL